MVKAITSWATGAVLFVSAATPTVAQSISQQVCAATQRYLAQRGTTIGEEALLASVALSNGSPWFQLSQSNSNDVTRGGNIYLAYFFNRPDSGPAGAVSIKISVFQEPNTNKATRIELYRPAIERGANRCEPRGRPAVENRRVWINEYIDYHSRTGSSSDLEDFHFSYPHDTNSCPRTDRPQEVAQTFQFPDVKPTTGTTLTARLIGPLIGQAYAVQHEFSTLRSELHYYRRANGMASCVGFRVPLNGVSRRASIRVHDLSSNWFSTRGAWLIHRQ
jgi:hypothetical protein